MITKIHILLDRYKLENDKEDKDIEKSSKIGGCDEKDGIIVKVYSI